MTEVRFFKTRERPFSHYRLLSVHVEARAEGMIWHQRHVWTREDGTLDVEPWIPSRAGFWRLDREVPVTELAAPP